MKVFKHLFLLIIGLLVSLTAIAQMPTISSLTQINGPTNGGSYVGIIGSNFKKSTVFKFDSERVILKRFINSTTVYVMTVAHTSGTVNITAENKDDEGFLENGFEFVDNPPYLDRIYVSNGITENNGPAEGNTIIHYYGNYFTPGMEINLSSINPNSSETTNVESIRRHFYHSKRMYSYTPVWDLEDNSNSNIDINIGNANGTSTLNKCFTFKDDSPSITRVWPESGIVQGGTLLRVWGRNFRASDNWKLGGTDIQFYFPNDNHIIKRGRSGFVYLQTEETVDTGKVNLTVTPANQEISSYSKANGFEYTSDPPEIETIYPNKGFSSGSTVYVRGKNISRDMLINFMLDGDSTTDTTADITRYYHDGLIRVKSPTRESVPTEGILVDVKLNNDNGSAVNYGGYTYLDLSPRIHYLWPNNGVIEGNQYVYIRGRNFEKDNTTVDFINKTNPNLHRVYRSNLLAIKTQPDTTPGNADVKITNSFGFTTLSNGYIYSEKTPLISTMRPSSGTKNGGTYLYIYGENFTDDTEVYIDNQLVPIHYFYHTRAIRVITPVHAEGKADITVKNRGEFFTVENAYKFYDAPPSYLDGAPVINRVYPLTGIITGGTYVYLYGTNLNKDTKVQFNGKPANIRRFHHSGKRITILTPPGDMGLVNIVTSNDIEEITFEDAFSYVAAKPVIKTVIPSKGFVYGGDYIYVYGDNFTKNMTLTLGGNQAIFKSLYHSGAARYLVAPNDGGPATVDLTVETVYGNDYLDNGFEYAMIKPEIRAIMPNHGKSTGGTWIRIYGSFFSPSIAVRLGANLVPVEDVIYYNPRYLRVKTPAYPTDHHKTLDIRLYSPGVRPTTERNAFTYVNPSVKLSEAK